MTAWPGFKNGAPAAFNRRAMTGLPMPGGLDHYATNSELIPDSLLDKDLIWRVAACQFSAVPYNCSQALENRNVIFSTTNAGADRCVQGDELVDGRRNRMGLVHLPQRRFHERVVKETIETDDGKAVCEMITL